MLGSFAALSGHAAHFYTHLQVEAVKKPFEFWSCKKNHVP